MKEDEAYSPSDCRSFTPPPPGIVKFAQPLLEKVSELTIPPNLQEILANVKRQEVNKLDPYLPPKPGATFLPSASTTSTLPKGGPQLPDKFVPTFLKTSTPPRKDTASRGGSTLSQLSDLDLIKKAEEELAAVAGASITLPDLTKPPPPLPVVASEEFKSTEQPKPQSLEDDGAKTPPRVFKSGVVMSVKRKADDVELSPQKCSRKVSRWGQAPNDI